MAERPGSVLARRPLHLIVLADCSGSMAADGKMRALNTAMRETIPHLIDVAGQNPHAELLLRVVAFSTGATWHVSDPTPVDQLRWTDLECGGYTDLGAGLRLTAAALCVPPMPERALPPALVLVSDGMPTDDWRAGLGMLMDEPWGQRAIRMALGIGRDADHEVLQRFIGNDDVEPVAANNPDQLARMLRWATTHASRVASTITRPDSTILPTDSYLNDTSEVIW